MCAPPRLAPSLCPIRIADVFSLSGPLQLQGLLNGSLESRWVGTDNLTDLVAVLEEQESRHGANGQLLRDLWELIDVDFVEFGGGEFVGESVDERRGG